MVKRVFPLVTVADLEAMPDDDNRYEVIDGGLFVSRAPSLTHQIIVSNVGYEFRKCLDAHPTGKILPGPGIIFDKFNGVIPDLVYVSNERFEEITDGIRFIAAPEIVIEILSPDRENEERDRFDKRYLYSKFEVQEYWILDAERRRVEVYRLLGSTLELAATFEGDDEVTSSVLPDFRCPVRRIFAS